MLIYQPSFLLQSKVTFMNIGPHSFDEFLSVVESFHGYAAPGVLIGGFMVELAHRNLPKGELFDVICETPKCLPDAIQLLTPCTAGNGWMKILNFGRYALSLYEKSNGTGIRVFVDPVKLRPWSEIQKWFFKLAPKKEQDPDLLREQIREAGFDICTWHPVAIKPNFLQRKSRGKIVTCPTCGEAYPAADGGICRACQGESPYLEGHIVQQEEASAGLRSKQVLAEEGSGRRALHEMTRIVPGESKAAVFKHGEGRD